MATSWLGYSGVPGLEACGRSPVPLPTARFPPQPTAPFITGSSLRWLKGALWSLLEQWILCGNGNYFQEWRTFLQSLGGHGENMEHIQRKVRFELLNLPEPFTRTLYSCLRTLEVTLKETISWVSRNSLRIQDTMKSKTVGALTPQIFIEGLLCARYWTRYLILFDKELWWKRETNGYKVELCLPSPQTICWSPNLLLQNVNLFIFCFFNNLSFIGV